MRNQLRMLFTLLLLSAYAADVCGQVEAGRRADVRSVDDTRAKAAGIRKIESRHLVLFTDLPSGPAIDALPPLFDQAVPLWAAYFGVFGVDPAETAAWQVRAFLVGDREKFAALGMLPQDYELVYGYSLGPEVWLVDQPTDYYRRHLLLHEGTHAFMNQFLGGCGPGWYMEGMAELLATHRLEAASNGTDQLTLGIMPGDRREVPMLGRIKLVRDGLAEDHALGLPAVMAIDSRQQLGNDSYAWCWAAAKFLDSHPQYRERFRTLQKHVRDADFNEVVKREFADDWDELLAEWQAFVATLEHGYNFGRMAIRFERGTPLKGKPRVLEIAVDRGWQSSGVWLEAGTACRVAAQGRYQIAVDKSVGGETRWPCEPGGVTIEYHDGRPLGMLLGAIVPDELDDRAGFARPFEIGLGTTVTPKSSGTLYLRVNDSAARLGDNRGVLTIRIAD